MAHDLRLSIRTFQIKPKHSREFVNFDEFFSADRFPVDPDLPISQKVRVRQESFVSLLKAKFNGQFKETANGDKAIAPLEFSFDPDHNIINGIMNGGTTNLPRDIFKRTDSSNSTGKRIESDELASLPYHFKIWFPLDFDNGVLMYHQYSSSSIGGSIMEVFSSIFNELDFTINWETFVPSGHVEQYIESSRVSELKINKRMLSREARRALNPLFADLDGLRVKISISGFGEDANWISRNVDRLRGTTITSLDIGEGSENQEIVAYFRDGGNRRAHAPITNLFEMKPTYPLPDTLKINGQEIPDQGLFIAYTDNVLANLKIEIGYTVTE